MVKAPRSFYEQPTLELAKKLLGKTIVRKIISKSKNFFLSGKIVETEAYIEKIDEACHAYKKKTPRNSIMFEKSGLLYVYFIYGNHFMANIVTEKKGVGAAILIRAVEPIKGIDMMKMYRKKTSINEIELTNGPGKFSQAFKISSKLNGESLLGEKIFILDQLPNISSALIASSTRIGITKSSDLKWRFFVKGNPFVSKR